MTPDGRHLLVGIMGEDYVEVIDCRRGARSRRSAPAGAHNFRAWATSAGLLVSNRVDNTVSIDRHVDAMKVVGDPGARRPRLHGAHRRRQAAVGHVALRQAGLGRRHGQRRKVVRTIPVGRSPHGIYLHNRAPCCDLMGAARPA
jgi:hypothetical protein